METSPLRCDFCTRKTQPPVMVWEGGSTACWVRSYLFCFENDNKVAYFTSSSSHNPTHYPPVLVGAYHFYTATNSKQANYTKMRFVLTILLCALVETGTSAVSGSEAGGGDEAQPAWEKPKAPRPKPFRMGRRKIQSAVIKEPKKEQSKVSFPSKSGRSRANSIKWVSKLLQNVARLLISKKRLNNGCRKCRQDWRGKQITAMADNPLYLPFRPVNGSSPPMVTLPIERMSKIKTYNRTIFRAYVDEEAWAAKEWVCLFVRHIFCRLLSYTHTHTYSISLTLVRDSS